MCRAPRVVRPLARSRRIAPVSAAQIGLVLVIGLPLSVVVALIRRTCTRACMRGFYLFAACLTAASIVVQDEGVRHLTDGVSVGGLPDRLPRLPGDGCTSSDDKTMRIAVRARALRIWG
jgi:hypothetical protein